MGATPLIFRTSRVSSESSASVTCEPHLAITQMTSNHPQCKAFWREFCHIPTKLSDQVCLVYNDAICKGQLLHCFILNSFGFLFMQVLEAVFGIHHGDDAILVFKCFKSGCGKGVFFQPWFNQVLCASRMYMKSWEIITKNDLSRTYQQKSLNIA